VALSILQFKLPDGSYLIPTPQTIINGQGFSALSIPCPFSANQFMTNVDYLMSSKSTLSGRFFVDAGTENAALPPTSGESIPGSPVDATNELDVSDFRDVQAAVPYLVAVRD